MGYRSQAAAQVPVPDAVVTTRACPQEVRKTARRRARAPGHQRACLAGRTYVRCRGQDERPAVGTAFGKRLRRSQVRVSRRRSTVGVLRVRGASTNRMVGGRPDRDNDRSGKEAPSWSTRDHAGLCRVSGVLGQPPRSKRRLLGRLPRIARDALTGDAAPSTSACPGACGLSRLSIPFTRCDVSGTPDLYLQRWCRRRRLRLETSSQAARGTGSGRRLQQCWPLHDPVNTTSFE